jgi:hypothetical protein
MVLLASTHRDGYVRMSVTAGRGGPSLSRAAAVVRLDSRRDGEVEST